MSKEDSKREEIEVILWAARGGDYSIDQAADKLLELLERKNELRDRFAAAALQGMLHSPEFSEQLDTIGTEKLAAKSYSLADAMLRARAA